MAKKRTDLKAAKAAKQKKIAIGGALLLVALLIFEVPKTLKMMHPSHQTAAPAATTQTATTPAASTTVPTVPVSNTPAVLTTQLAPPARAGQLSVLSASFKSKDPFRQLVNDDATSATSSSTTTTTSTTTDTTLKVVPSSKPAATPQAAPAATAPAPAPAPAASAAPKVVLPIRSAVISLNGVRQGVNLKVDFPADAPLFHLVSLTKKTAKVSIAGGSLASGKVTLTLRRGKPVTLVNTADGTRYKLLLVSTSTGEAVTPATAQTPAAGTQATTPTTTTTTPTTTTPTVGG
jgi:hypothetical protein